MTTTIDCITALFCQVDDHLSGLPKHPEARLWPSEVGTLGLLHALTSWPARRTRPLAPRGGGLLKQHNDRGPPLDASTTRKGRHSP